jgi:AmiR/NasT family two-component response regulator
MLDEIPAPVRVLIAEDETIIRMDLRGLLEKNGFQVVAEAGDGEQAVELARTSDPDVAVIDLRMPKLDGIEAARRIYAERPLPIVMLTAYSDRANVENAIGAGVFAYLVKPFRETDVVPAVRAAVARHAELLAARRSAGETPVRAIVMGVRSRSGGEWNVRIAQRDDGSVDVQGVVSGSAEGGA